MPDDQYPVAGNAAQYGTSGVQWQRDPASGTTTLSNTPPEMQAPLVNKAPSDVAKEMFQEMMGMTGKTMTESELKNYSLGMAMRDRTRGSVDPRDSNYGPSGELTKAEARRLWRDSHRSMRSKDPEERITAFSNLMDNGLAWITPEGDLYSSFAGGDKNRMLEVSREWQHAWDMRNKGMSPDDLREYSKSVGNNPDVSGRLKFWSGLGQPSPTSDNPQIPAGDYYDPRSRTQTTIIK